MGRVALCGPSRQCLGQQEPSRAPARPPTARYVQVKGSDHTFMFHERERVLREVADLIANRAGAS